MKQRHALRLFSGRKLATAQSTKTKKRKHIMPLAFAFPLAQAADALASATSLSAACCTACFDIVSMYLYVCICMRQCACECVSKRTYGQTKNRVEYSDRPADKRLAEGCRKKDERPCKITNGSTDRPSQTRSRWHATSGKFRRQSYGFAAP